ncbi:17275_t:CDS:2 [Acaulospora morrowiae]|uniref:17275_t:CDS:1 n=1 Tax=Acaulospora morrowiae TaxID=94023 RepID=A0A9N9GFG8_9GLOM|nr:17275_t:CDS:2 [Acaulospora morrowiae]
MKQRPDLSCVVDDVPLLNSEIKPMGVCPLSKKKDFVKRNSDAPQSWFVRFYLYLLEAFQLTQVILYKRILWTSNLMDYIDHGPILTTKLAIDEPSLPLVESNLAHFVALERRVCEFAKDYKRRKGPFTPPLQIQYMRNIPDSTDPKHNRFITNNDRA